MSKTIDTSNIEEKEIKDGKKIKPLIDEETIKITRAQLAEIFQSCKSRTITIKNLVIGTEIDQEKTISNFAAKANGFLKMSVAQINKKYAEKMEYLEKATLPRVLYDLYSMIHRNGWKLSFTPDFILIAEKTYDPPKELSEATYRSDLIVYTAPFCVVKKILIHLNSIKLTRVDVELLSGAHPNINNLSGCLGNLSDIKLNFNDPNSLAEMIYNVEKTFLLPSLDSSYSKPSVEVKEKKKAEGVWSV
jgi:hypothetical protein